MPPLTSPSGRAEANRHPIECRGGFTSGRRVAANPARVVIPSPVSGVLYAGLVDDLLDRAEARRAAALAAVDTVTQTQLGQFFTPARTASLVASLPSVHNLTGPVRVLDPGAGSGSLAAALVARLAAERPGLAVHVVAVEKDTVMVPYLAATLADCETIPGVTTELVAGDYLIGATGLDPDPRMLGPFDLVIMNPPYGKMKGADPSRQMVALEHVDTPNLYAAFWALGIATLAPGGQCVAIVPRSWANGAYFESFRKWLLDRLRLDTLHVFESRSSVFADMGVLQENVIVSGTMGGVRGGSVELSVSVGGTDALTRQKVPASAVVDPSDRHAFVRFTDGASTVPLAACHSLAELGLTVSTGRVVDFRARDHLSNDASEVDTAPLIYPGNVRGGGIMWPRSIGKPQALRVSDDTARRLLVPAGVYTVTKRFSAKEERRRVVAGVWDRPGPVAFENHLNYFHERGHGLPMGLARGLSVWLNSSPVDTVFRTFSGHTQVNAGDLRTLPYPSLDDLSALGRAIPGTLPGQAALDAIVFSVLSRTDSVAS